MAAAFKEEDRTHYPLVSPLEDFHPHLAHRKPRWPTSAYKLYGFTNKGPLRPDYTHGRHRSQRGDDDLIILNLYRYVTIELNAYHEFNHFNMF